MPSDLVKKNRGKPSVKAAIKRKPVDQMTHIEIALTFCKECLSWQDAKTLETNQENKIYHFDKNDGWISFDFGSLKSVMPAVREWLSAMDAYEVEEKFEGMFNFSFGSYFVGAIDEAEICRELLATCVEAKRDKS